MLLLTLGKCPTSEWPLWPHHPPAAFPTRGCHTLSCLRGLMISGSHTWELAHSAPSLGGLHLVSSHTDLVAVSADCPDALLPYFQALGIFLCFSDPVPDGSSTVMLSSERTWTSSALSTDGNPKLQRLAGELSVVAHTWGSHHAGG